MGPIQSSSSELSFKKEVTLIPTRFCIPSTLSKSPIFFAYDIKSNLDIVN